MSEFVRRAASHPNSEEKLENFQIRISLRVESIQSSAFLRSR